MGAALSLNAVLQRIRPGAVDSSALCLAVVFGSWSMWLEHAGGQEPSTTQVSPTAATVTTSIGETLATRIDQLLATEKDQWNAAEAEAGQLLRRLSLDLRGVVPTQDELDAFVADPSPNRWETWVDKFLADPLCDEHLVNFLDRTLMLRRGHVQVDRMAWINYLREQVATDVPLDLLAKQLLYSPWWKLEHRPAQRFFLDRGGDPNMITRDLSRVFLGRDMQCAQCHDHPLVDDFKQIDYQGLLAFVSTSSLTEVTYKDAEGKDQKTQMYVERAAGDAPFESVFEKGVSYRTGPRFVEQAELTEEYELPDARYLEAAPEGSLAGANLPPKRSRRQALADQLSSRSNRAFVTNWANRIWSLAFGQGLVQPLDMHHPHNPASHPELLSLISDGLIESDLRPRKFLRELTLSHAYRRGAIARVASEVSESATDPPLDALRESTQTNLAAAISNRESLAAAETQALSAYQTARDAWLKIQGERASARFELDAAETAMMAAKQKSNDAAQLHVTAQKRQTDTTARISSLDEAAAKLEEALKIAGTEDAELQQAIVVVKQRADTARGSLPEVEKAVADTKSAADTLGQELTTTIANIQTVVTKLQTIQQSLLAADATTINHRSQWSDACEAQAVNESRIRRYERMMAWFEALAAADRISGELAVAVRSVAEIEAEIPASEQLLATAQSQWTAAQNDEQTAATALVEARAVVQRQSVEITQLEQSLEALANSAKLVSISEPLLAAQTTISSELETRRTQTVASASAVETASQSADVAAKALTNRAQELAVQQAARKAIDDRIATVRTAISSNETALASAESLVQEKRAAIQVDTTRQLATASLQPLSPEQMCWSTLRITGVLDAYIRTEAAELEKQSPLAADADAVAKANRHRQAVRGAFDKLRGIADVYVTLYSSGPDNTEDDFFASADQALYVSNAGSVFAWAGPGNDNVTQRAIALTDNSEIARLIYWTMLARQPTEDEVRLVNEQLVAAGDGRPVVIQEMVWGLLASAEFRFAN